MIGGVLRLLVTFPLLTAAIDTTCTNLPVFPDSYEINSVAVNFTLHTDDCACDNNGLCYIRRSCDVAPKLNDTILNMDATNLLDYSYNYNFTGDTSIVPLQVWLTFYFLTSFSPSEIILYYNCNATSPHFQSFSYPSSMTLICGNLSISVPDSTSEQNQIDFEVKCDQENGGECSIYLSEVKFFKKTTQDCDTRLSVTTTTGYQTRDCDTCVPTIPGYQTPLWTETVPWNLHNHRMAVETQAHLGIQMPGSELWLE